MTTYYKAVREDGYDFATGTIKYEVGKTIKHPAPHKRDASGYLSVTVDPTDIPGGSWPLRMLEVKARWAWKDGGSYKNKRCTHKIKVLREVDASQYFGVNGAVVVEMIEEHNSLSNKHRTALADKLQATGIIYTYAPLYLRDSGYNVPVMEYYARSLVQLVVTYDLLGSYDQVSVDEALKVWDDFMTRKPVRKSLALALASV